MAAETTAKVIFKGENKIGSAVNSAKNDLNGFQSIAQTVGSKIASALSFTGVIIALKKVADGLVNCTKAAIENEKYMVQLETALGGSEEAFDAVNDKIDELEKRTIGAGDSIKALATELASMGMTSSQVNDMLEATASLSVATGVSIDTAYNALNSTLQGTGTRLEKLGIDLSNVTAEELEQGKAIQLTIEKYSELSKTIANKTTAQTLENISTTMDNIRENLGSALLDAISPALMTIYGWLLSIESWTNRIKEKQEDNAKFQSDQNIIDQVVSDINNGINSKALLMQLDIGGLNEVLEQFATKESGRTEAVIEDYQDLVNYVNGIIKYGMYKDSGSTYGGLSSVNDGGEDDIAAFLKAIQDAIDAVKNADDGTTTPTTTSPTGTLATKGELFANFLETDLLGPLQESLGVFGDMIGSITPGMILLKPVIEGFVGTLGPMLEQVIKPLEDVLSWIGSSLAQTLVPILDAVMPIISAISDILQGTLMPIIVMLAKLFTILASPVQYIADLFSWLGEWVAYLGYKISNIFSSNKQNVSKPGAFSSDAFSGLGARLAGIGSDSFDTIAEASTSSPNASSYSGATTVHINIYQNAPVCGDGGLREFAQMIREEFASLDYYGVTA